MITFNPQIQPDDVIAVGDIHGRFDLLAELVDRVRGKQCTLVFLGDMVDRGPQDVEVLTLIEDMTQDPDKYGLNAVYALRGNHEEMFVSAVGDGYGWTDWIRNGGSYDKVSDLKPFVSWVRGLPLYLVISDTLFIHAGVNPGQDPKEAIRDGKAQSLLWIRGVFLLHGAELWKWTDKIKRVVHGHTVTAFEREFGGEEGMPLVYKDRVNIDTGAVFTNVLTAYNVTQNTFWQHIFEDESNPTETPYLPVF
jgi:serine/threonine protein phosphatase 1